MDPTTIVNTFIAILTPMIAKGVGEVANSAFKDVYARIKEKLSGKPEEENALEQFERDPVQGAEDFQEALIAHLKTDEELMKQISELLKTPERHSPLVGKVDAKNVVIAEKIDKIDFS